MFGLKKKMRYGSTRIVFVFDKFVIKVPYWKNWKRFLKGLVANINESSLSRAYPDSNLLVPVTWAMKGGWILIMPKVRDCPPPLVAAFMVDLFRMSNPEDHAADEIKRFCEYIVDNYGMYKGVPRCRDYGTFMPPVAVQADIDRELDMLEYTVIERLKQLDNHGNRL